jgi:hypothetical protein
MSGHPGEPGGEKKPRQLNRVVEFAAHSHRRCGLCARPISAVSQAATGNRYACDSCKRSACATGCAALDRRAIRTKVECAERREEIRLLAANNWQIISFEHGPFVDPHSESLAYVVQTHPVRRR